VNSIVIRTAVPADAARLREIYEYYVLRTAVSFEYAVPSVEEFAERIRGTLESYPYLVLEEAGVVTGYAYAGPFKKRDAYARSCELSVYLDREARRRGLGRALYEALEEELRARGFRNLYACIADPIGEDEYLTRASENFHSHMGYRLVGTFRKCAYKFGHWYNMVWMEKLIGDHPQP
jgi:phosphinothricin acetyltransferase